MSDRQMPSIFHECDELKQVYDKCFSEFFQKFITPNYRHQYAVNPCERLHEAYNDCVKERLEKTKIYDIDLDELRKEVIGSEEDKLKHQQQQQHKK
ncbi:unnamed protein product, partial [Mesorhabditis belari]|uniref:COX assembly mitochondrial protein n=1 Tax=Mesorhabditis belari TaxID=2138241 RepID=A0AAF3EMC8_9BILA